MTCPFGIRKYLRGLLPILLLFGFAYSFFIYPSSTYAQTSYSDALGQDPYQTLNVNPDVPINQRTAVDVLVINIMSSMVCHLSGIDVMRYAPSGYATPGQSSCLGIDRETGKIGFVENGHGAVGMMGNLIAVLYQKPAGTGDYTSYLASNFGFAPKAEAQATGFTALQKLINVWAVFRNITYLIFVIAFIIIGFLIMLRVKIDPRTVMSIQNTIPRLIVGIILITFSYAIAGLLIDFMWVSTYLSIGVMGEAIEETEPENVNTFEINDVTQNIQDYPFGFFNRVFAGNFYGVGFLGTLEFARNAADGVGILFRSLTGSDNVGGQLLDNAGEVGESALQGVTGIVAGSDYATNTYGLTAKYLGGDRLDFLGLDGDSSGEGTDGCSWYQVWCRVGNAVTGILGNVIEAAFTIIFSVISWLLSILAFLVILVALVVTLFRIWFTLLKAYIYILLSIVWAPFWIIFGIVPGSSINFIQWIKTMVAHLVLFPATIVMFLMARTFLYVFEPSGWFSDDSGSIFLPPLVGNANIPEAIGPIIAFSVLMYTPNMLNILRDALKAPAGKYSASAGQGLGAGISPIKGAVGSGVAYQQEVKGPGQKGGLGAVLGRLF